MATKLVSQIVKEAAEKSSVNDKVSYLNENMSEPLKMMLMWGYDPLLKLALPEGTPPYTEADEPELDGQFWIEFKKLPMFEEGIRQDIPAAKLEYIYIQLLESVHPEDAKMINDFKDNKYPKGLTATTIKKVLPEIFE